MDDIQGRKRKQWIDFLRGLAVLFVLFGHVLEKTDSTYYYYVFTSPIKIPLFFVISGYLFNCNRSFPAFFKRVWTGLILPWLVLSILPIVVISAIKGIPYFYENVGDVVTGRSVWYMPCCIIAELMFFFIVKATRKITTLSMLIICIVSALIGEMLIVRHQLDFLMFNRALTVQLFLLAGYLFKRYEKQLDEIKGVYLWCGVCLYVMLGMISIICYPGANLDVHTGEYYNPAISISMILIGCFCIFYIAKRYDWKSRVITFVGQNSLVFYIWAGYGLAAFTIVSSFTGMIISNQILLAIAQFFAICIFCTIASIVINRFLPEAVGRKRVRKSVM